MVKRVENKRSREISAVKEAKKEDKADLQSLAILIVVCNVIPLFFSLLSLLFIAIEIGIFHYYTFFLILTGIVNGVL